MNEDTRRPTLPWAMCCMVLPVAVILYGTLVVGVRPPVLPLICAVALAGLLCRKIGFTWEELQTGMFEALARIQIAIAILAMVGMIIAAWLASGTIPAIIYWGLRLIAPEHFLVSCLLLSSVASIATGTSFGTIGTLGVALILHVKSQSGHARLPFAVDGNTQICTREPNAQKGIIYRATAHSVTGERFRQF